MALLSRPLALHNVSDVEKLCRQVLGRYVGSLSPDDFDDALAFLIETAWRISLSYEPARDQRRDFASFAGHILDRRIYDWLRQRRGRTRWIFKDRVYERELPVVLSLNAPINDRELDPLGETLADWAGDPQADSGPPCGGLLVAGDQQRDRDFDLLREAAARRPRGRA